ncbi:hypothetical protein [Nocardioides sp. InS609-2]|uniref:hypothetical protein n=1 Tax=Nocardioides sp. InS609-2 TaxID=2760705 RepID=UPI0020BFCD7F|nr:hypothetical protein [Nocardioides sp. InS609-2]
MSQLLSDFGHDLPLTPVALAATKEARLFRPAPRRGAMRAGRGWAAAGAPASAWRMTSDQAPVLWPFIGAPGLPPTGAQMGIDQLSGGSFYADPLGWVLRDDVPVTNPNIFYYSKPGTGKSATVKAFCNRMMPFGYRTLILGDPKDEYEKLCRAHGVEPFVIGPGMWTRINPLSKGPLGQGWDRLDATEAQRRATIIFARWLTLVRGLVGSMRIGTAHVPFGPTEADVVHTALEFLTGYAQGSTELRETTIPELWHLLHNPTPELVRGCQYATERQFLDETRLLRNALGQLVKGTLAGLFDDHTNIDVDWRAPIQSLSLSRLDDLGDEAVGIALLCVNSWGRGLREIAEPGDLRIVVRDEVWKQLRLGVSAVQSFDADLRLSRGMAGRGGDIQWANLHKPSDLLSVGDGDSQATAIAKDLLELADIKILGGQKPKVARELDTMLGLGPIAQDLVTGWAMQGKGRALWCVGESTYKVQTVLHPVERELTWTNEAIEGGLMTVRRISDAFSPNLHMVGGLSACLRSCSPNSLIVVTQVVVFDGLEVTRGAFDSEVEHVTGAADIAAGDLTHGHEQCPGEGCPTEGGSCVVAEGWPGRRCGDARLHLFDEAAGEGSQAWVGPFVDPFPGVGPIGDRRLDELVPLRWKHCQAPARCLVLARDLTGARAVQHAALSEDLVRLAPAVLQVLEVAQGIVMTPDGKRCSLLAEHLCRDLRQERVRGRARDGQPAILEYPAERLGVVVARQLHLTLPVVDVEPRLVGVCSLTQLVGGGVGAFQDACPVLCPGGHPSVDLTDLRLLVGVEFLRRNDEEVHIGVDVSGAEREGPFEVDAYQVVPKRGLDALGEVAENGTQEVSFVRVQLSVQFRQHVQQSRFLAVERLVTSSYRWPGPEHAPTVGIARLINIPCFATSGSSVPRECFPAGGRPLASGTPLALDAEIGVLDGLEVAGGAFDAEAEEVTDAAHVAAGGVDLVEDAVLAQGTRSYGAVFPGEGVAAGDESGCGASVDEQVGVGASRPGLVAVVEPRSEPCPDGCGEWDVAAVEEKPAVDDVGQLQLAHLLAGEGVESDQGHGEGDGRVRRVQLGANQCGVQRERDVGRHASEVDASHGVGEDEAPALEDLNSDFRPFSAKCLWVVSAGSAARAARMSSLVISANDWRPASAQAWTTGARPRMCSSTVAGSRGSWRGACRDPPSMICSHSSSCWRISGGRAPESMNLAVKNRSTWVGTSSISRPASARTSMVEEMVPS